MLVSCSHNSQPPPHVDDDKLFDELLEVRLFLSCQIVPFPLCEESEKEDRHDVRAVVIDNSRTAALPPAPRRIAQFSYPPGLRNQRSHFWVRRYPHLEINQIFLGQNGQGIFVKAFSFYDHHREMIGSLDVEGPYPSCFNHEESPSTSPIAQATPRRNIEYPIDYVNDIVRHWHSASTTAYPKLRACAILRACLTAQASPNGPAMLTSSRNSSWTLPLAKSRILPQSKVRIPQPWHSAGSGDRRGAERGPKVYRPNGDVKSPESQRLRAGKSRMSNLPFFDQAIFETINRSEEEIERELTCDLLYFFGEIRPHVFQYFRNFVEEIAARPDKRDSLGICLKTPGGSAETVEKLVDVSRHFFKNLYFIVPDMAMSAGTIFCMAGDKIYMDYSSSLGPIDPQVPDKEDKLLIPALGYLDKIAELIKKSEDDTITAVEFAIVEKQDLAMLNYYEQARDLSIALLEKWLCNYKFKDWTIHRTTNPGTSVTLEDKQRRAQEIATKLADNKYWHSHGRMIGMDTLRAELRLEIDDFGQNAALQKNIRRYSDTLSEWLIRQGMPFFLHSRHVNNF
jgi:hypothetical protein